MNKIHIGEEIRKIAQKRGITAAEIAERINRSRQTVHSYFNRDSIDTADLMAIGEVLDHDFFQHYVNPHISRDGGRGAQSSSVSLVLNVPSDRIGVLLRAAFGDFNGNVLLSSLPDASHR